jgi:hypothetical protein
MTTRYSLPEHLSTDDHDRAARARTLAALVLACGVFALVAVAGAALLPRAEPDVAVAPEAPAAVALPGA